MNIIEINEKNHNYKFICNWHSTRSGFAHDCDLMIDNDFITAAHCYYYNRTWEAWDYQSVCIKAIWQEIDTFIDELKDLYKREHNYKVLTKKRAEDFERTLSDNEYLESLRACKDNLQHNRH